jgi:hypothetical protein
MCDARYMSHRLLYTLFITTLYPHQKGLNLFYEIGLQLDQSPSPSFASGRTEEVAQLETARTAVH